MRDYNIESDLKQEKFEVIKLVQGDKGNKLTINVLEDGKPVSLTGCSITAKYKRADGQVINGSVINISNNSFDAVIDSDITKVVGTLKMLFSIEKDDVKVSTFLLLADVREGLLENTGSSGGSTGGGEVTVDLSNYYKKNETYSKAQIDSQFKEIADKIDEIASSGGSGSSGGTTTSDYDTEITLPFTANKDTDVKVVFSKGDEISNPSYTNEVSGNTPNDFDVQKYGSPTDYTLENVTEEGINCLKFQYTGGVHYYRLYSKQDTSKKYGSDIYFVYMKIKLVGDADATYLPKAMTHISYDTTSIQGFNGVSQLEDQLKNITDWQELCIAGKVAQNDNYMNLKPYIGFSQITGTVYIARMCLVNLTTQGLESKTKDELLEMARSGRFDNGGSTSTTEFSCTVTNGSVTEDITPFTDTGVTKYYTVSNGNTFSVSKRTEYGMPSIQVFIKSSTATEIEDSDIKINTRFKGKKVIFEGDSITDYDYLEGYNNKSWANYLTTILGMNLVSNGAVGGSLLTHSNEADGYSVQQRIANITYDSNTKLFLIHAGTNDWGQAKTLGEIDSTDISTICGALNNIIDKVQTNCPKATIVIISPIHRQSDHGGFLNNSANYSLYDVAIAYEKICKRWGVKFINGLEIGLNALNSNNLATNYLDGLHPTPIGHKIMAVEFARKIATF